MYSNIQYLKFKIARLLSCISTKLLQMVAKIKQAILRRARPAGQNLNDTVEKTNLRKNQWC